MGSSQQHFFADLCILRKPGRNSPKGARKLAAGREFAQIDEEKMGRWKMVARHAIMYSLRRP